MTHDDFEYMRDLIAQKKKMKAEIDDIQRRISELNTKLRDPVKELFRPLVGRYFRKTGINGVPGCLNDWFIVEGVPKDRWCTMTGCDLDEYLVPVKFMLSDGMPRHGTVGIAPEHFLDNGATLPEYVIEITEDEWFSEQRRRVHADADRHLKEIIDENKR